MSREPQPRVIDELLEEIRNFEEIARYLKPSSGEVPVLRGIDIAGRSLPLRHVLGGDHIIYLDFNKRFNLDARIARAVARKHTRKAELLGELKRRAGILLADVSGHRMTDALLTAMLHQAFLLGAHYELDRSGEITTRLFEHINARFYRTTAVSKYFTMIYGEITEGGRFRFISAGHQPPAIFSREFGRFVPLDDVGLTSFPPVGMLPSSAGVDDATDDVFRGKKRYEVNELNLLATGDVLLLMTDGLAEHGGDDFLVDALEPAMRETAGESADTVADRIVREVTKHGEQKDDVSFIVIRRAL